MDEEREEREADMRKWLLSSLFTIVMALAAAWGASISAEQTQVREKIEKIDEKRAAGAEQLRAVEERVKSTEQKVDEVRSDVKQLLRQSGSR